MLLELQDSQLVLVDYQSQLMPVMHEGEAVLRNGVRLAQMAHLLKVPTWGTEQNPERLGHNPVEISEVCRRTLAKMSFGACEEGLGEVRRPQASAPSGNARRLPRHLQKAAPAPVRNSVVIAGCEAHICLLQTALGLLEEEFEVWVVTDACASRSERNRDAAFDRLAGAGAELLTTELVAFEWLRTAEHPQFKPVQALIQ